MQTKVAAASETMGDTNGTVSTDASKTTAFATQLKKLAGPLAANLGFAVLGFPFYVAAIPFLVVLSRLIRSERGETSLQFWTKYLVLVAIYCGFHLGLAFVVFFPLFGPVLTGYHTLPFFLAILTITLHDRRYQYGVFGNLVLRNCFDRPLVAAGYVCREFFGLRLLAPFANIFDETIVQGSMPFPSDIATLANEPYNVGLVVNMCREYDGARAEMKKHGVVQCHLPHQDTTAPSYDSLVKGCAYIQQFRKHNPNKRVFVHCKGGIGRASTVSLAHYVRNEGEDPVVAISRMKSVRPVIYAGVKDYPAIRRLNEERLKSSSGNKQRKQE